MRDYLTNLVARSLDQTVVIQPRLASLFEPRREVGPMFSRSFSDRLKSTPVSEAAAPDLIQARPANRTENDETSSSPGPAAMAFDESSHPEDIEPGTPRVQKQERRPVAPIMKPAAGKPPKLEKQMDDIGARFQIASTQLLPKETDTQAVVPAGRLSPAVNAVNERLHRNESSSVKGLTPAARNERAHTSLVDIHEPNRSPSATRLQEKSVEQSASERSNEQRVASMSAIPARVAEANQQSESKALVVPRIVMQRTSAVRDQQSTVSVPVSVVPNVEMPRSSTNDLGEAAGFRARPKEIREPSQTEIVEPVINVTIGRIEVRAVAPATVQPKDRNPKSRSKLMTLDDYLRQRAQGGRR